MLKALTTYTGPPPVPQATSVSTTATSRLELYFFYGNAPVLPFPGSYPIGLLRQFIPSGYEVEALIISDLGTGYIRKKYAQRVIQTIWNYGSNNPFTLLQYDCVNGSSKYVQSYQGGSFSIHHWMNKTRATCNCYDLAAISYLAYLILANCMNNPVRSQPVDADSCGSGSATANLRPDRLGTRPGFTGPSLGISNLDLLLAGPSIPTATRPSGLAHPLEGLRGFKIMPTPWIRNERSLAITPGSKPSWTL